MRVDVAAAGGPNKMNEEPDGACVAGIVRGETHDPS